MTRKLASIIICLQIAVSLVSPARAANKPKADSAMSDVQGVLQSESSSGSLSVDRRRALSPEQRQHASDSVWWQAGCTRSEKHWVQYEQSAATGERAKLLDDYAEHRDVYLKRPHGQVQLAEWCRSNHLFDQERVHLLNALADRDETLDVENAYRRLGCKKVGDVWVSPQEQRDAAHRIAEIEESYKRWGSKFQSIKELLQGTQKQRAIAEQQMAAITDRSAVPAIVNAFCTADQSSAELGVNSLDQIPDFQASRALAGQAVFSPWRGVRKYSTELLQRRKLEEFAPDLLMLLSNPIRTGNAGSARITPAKTQNIAVPPDMVINLDYVWVEETRDTIRVGIRRLFPISAEAHTTRIVSNFHPGMRGTYSSITGARKIDDSEAQFALLELIEQKEMLDDKAERINDLRVNINDRVGKVLSSCTKQPESSDPKIWWDWWTQFSSVAPTDQKNVVIVDERASQPNVPSLSSRTTQISCLVAGTPIWTERGFVAIDQIRSGDRVLSKDINSGELDYKPVLRTTERAPTPVHKFTVGDESISASFGHHFWVSGEGWTKTRELAPQKPLHTATGMQRISDVEDEGRVEKVYNLVVADFHTYFVGKEMVLSHDVQTPSLTNVKVPGLTPK